MMALHPRPNTHASRIQTSHSGATAVQPKPRTALTLRLGSAGRICNYISPRTVAVALFAISHHPQRFKQTVPAQLAHVHASGDEE